MGGWRRASKQHYQYGEFRMDDDGDRVGEWRRAKQQDGELGVDEVGHWGRRIPWDAESWWCAC